MRFVPSQDAKTGRLAPESMIAEAEAIPVVVRRFHHFFNK
jgi:hypothetical protein